MPVSHQKIPHRTDIDGLRGIAVILVVLFHTFPSRFRGGFIGVDVFFVISGFLITTIILEDLKSNRFSFLEFYIRRIRRIFPSLITVLLFCLVLGWFTLFSVEFSALGKHILGGVSFCSNFILLQENNYFDNLAEFKPLLHLWSLAIEEQFYLVWPLVIWAFSKTRRHILFLIIPLGLTSFFLCQLTTSSDTTQAFYLPHTRIWELLIGASIVAIKPNDFSTGLKSRILTAICSATGLILLISSLIIINRESVFPGKLALLPTLATGLLLLAGSYQPVTRNILSMRLLVWFGKISFPLYLWHWPFLAFARIFEYDPLPKATRICSLMLSIFVSWITYRFIENPFRLNLPRRLAVTSLVFTLIACGILGYLTIYSKGFEHRFSQYEPLMKTVDKLSFPGNLQESTFDNISFQIQKSKRKNTTLFVGDSNIIQYYTRLDELVQISPEQTNTIMFITRAGCLPIPETKFDNYHHYCDNLMESANKLAVGNPDIETVVIGASWVKYFVENIGIGVPIQVGDSEYFRLLNNLEAFIKGLVENKKQVFLVFNIPSDKELDPKFFLHRNLKNPFKFFQIRSQGIPIRRVEATIGRINRDLLRTAKRSGAKVIDPFEFLCEGNFCPNISKDGKPIYSDRLHLNPSFVRTQGVFLDSTVQTN